MRLALLVFSLMLSACGDASDAPVVVDATDVAVVAEPSDPDTLLVEDAGLGDAGVLDPADAPTAPSTVGAEASEVDESDAGPSEVYVGMWVGEEPLSNAGTHFAAVPPVRAKLEEAFSVEPGLLDKLLATPALYTAPPIEDVGSMLGLTFEPTEANADDRTLHLLVADDASHVFAFLASPNGDTFYRASYDASAASLPADAAAWMSRNAGTDFAAMVRENDETELGP